MIQPMRKRKGVRGFGGMVVVTRDKAPKRANRMNGLVEKVMGILGFEENTPSAASESVAQPHRSARDNVISLPTSRQMRMVIARPNDFDQVQEMAEYLRARQPVLLNLEGTDKMVSRRLLDFLNGVVYALGGSTEKVADAIFVFSPPNVELSYVKDEFALDGIK